MKFNNDDWFNKLSDERQKFKITCECGHRLFIPEFRKKVICGWCGHYVYKNEKEKFKDKLLKEMKKN